jgi:threonine dehydrogenase-like Zn-dependent dehydrogenase
MPGTMKAAVFEGHERIVLEEKPIPGCGPNDAIVKISLTTICGTDVHIWREEYPVEQGRIVGHEPVGTIHKLGEAVSGYEVGERVLVGAITPCGTCFNVRIGQTVAVFAQGPIGLCATAGARLMGASLVIGVDRIEGRLSLSHQMGADETIDFSEEDPIAAIKRLTGGRGVDVAIEALGTQQTFEACLEATRPGGIVSSLGVYGGKLEVPLEPFVYGIGDKQILTTLCPGGKERMRKLMEMVRHGRLDLTPLITHRFSLDQIEEAYDLFGNQREGVVKVGLTP